MSIKVLFQKNKPLKKAWLLTLLDLMMLMLSFFIMGRHQNARPARDASGNRPTARRARGALAPRQDCRLRRRQRRAFRARVHKQRRRQAPVLSAEPAL